MNAQLVFNICVIAWLLWQWRAMIYLERQLARLQKDILNLQLGPPLEPWS